jgi:hypothetical protein
MKQAEYNLKLLLKRYKDQRLNIMEAEQLNLLANMLDDISERAAALRGYL